PSGLSSSSVHQSPSVWFQPACADNWAAAGMSSARNLRSFSLQASVMRSSSETSARNAGGQYQRLQVPGATSSPTRKKGSGPIGDPAELLSMQVREKCPRQ